MPTIVNSVFTPDGATTVLSSGPVQVGDVVVLQVNNNSNDSTVAVSAVQCTVNKTAFATNEAQVHGGSGLNADQAYQFAVKVLTVTGGSPSVQFAITNHTGTTRRLGLRVLRPDAGQQFSNPPTPSRKAEVVSGGSGNPWNLPYTGGAANASPQVLLENNQAGSLGNFDFGSGEAIARDGGLNGCEFRATTDADGNASQGNFGGTLSGATVKTIAVGVWSTTNLVIDYTKTIDDTVGITDQVTRARDLARTINDAVGVADGVTNSLQGQDLVKTVNDTVNVTDDLAEAIVRTINDTVGVVDEGTASLGSPDEVMLTDEIAVGYNKVLTDTVGVSDSIDVFIPGTHLKGIAETVHVTDTVSRALGTLVADHVAVTDNVNFEVTTDPVLLLKKAPKKVGRSFSSRRVL